MLQIIEDFCSNCINGIFFFFFLKLAVNCLEYFFFKFHNNEAPSTFIKSSEIFNIVHIKEISNTRQHSKV